MAQLTELATVLSFSDRGTIANAAAAVTRYLTAVGGANLTTDMSAVVTRSGTLRNLFWSYSPTGTPLTASGNSITVMVNGTATPLTSSWNGAVTSGSDTTNSVSVVAGDRVSVRLRLAGSSPTKSISKPSASFELEVASTNPWQTAGTDAYYDQGNIGIGTPTPGEMLTVNGVVESSLGGFKFPDGSIQSSAAGSGAIPATSLFGAANGNIGMGTTSPEERLTLVAGSNSATEMATPSGVTANSVAGAGLPTSTTYYFRIVAEDGAGGTTTGSLPDVSCTTTSANRRIQVAWSPVRGATNYRVYVGSAPGNPNGYFGSPSNSFLFSTDSGYVTPANVPTTTTACVNKFAALGDSWLLGGNIGIGTTNPTASLHVAGTFYAPGSIVQVVTSVLTTDLGPGAINAWSANLATLTITPKFANSKIIVRLSTNLGLVKTDFADPHTAGYVRIVVNATKVAGAGVFYTRENAPGRAIPVSLLGEFSPGSVGPVTFGIQLQQRAGLTVANLQNSAEYGPGMFMAEEIAQ